MLMPVAETQGLFFPGRAGTQAHHHCLGLLSTPADAAFLPVSLLHPPPGLAPGRACPASPSAMWAPHPPPSRPCVSGDSVQTPGGQGHFREASQPCWQPNQCLHLPSWAVMPCVALILCIIIIERRSRRGNQAACLRVSVPILFPLFSLLQVPIVIHVRKREFFFHFFPTCPDFLYLKLSELAGCVK